MKDRDFLIWLHRRLEIVHGENECFDYMHKLRNIIKATPPDKCTRNTASHNSLQGLIDEIKNETKDKTKG